MAGKNACTEKLETLKTVDAEPTPITIKNAVSVSDRNRKRESQLS